MEESIVDYKLADIMENGQWYLERLHGLLPEFWVQQIINSPRIEPHLDRPIGWFWVESVQDIPKPREVYLQLANIP
ncbi:hypothetical protein QJS04_geneDACA020147 [Acorus gramineus]|uniref:Uncharacterized protein n=1 Tax=Acorus gramineus TaxID=55184 RepID=A0AAV9BQT2_ACOGR|nr:hypothetical protein QJS04_geneDACA020147 [Acorus gramineus]